MVSLSAMFPELMACRMSSCSWGDRLQCGETGDGDASTPCSHGWDSISSRGARFDGSLCSIREIRLKESYKQKTGMSYRIITRLFSLRVSLLTIDVGDSNTVRYLEQAIRIRRKMRVEKYWMGEREKKDDMRKRRKKEENVMADYWSRTSEKKN